MCEGIRMTTPEKDEKRRAYDRLALLTGVRAGGVVLMVLGIYLLLGGSIFGHYGFGGVLFVFGALEGLVLPAFLARRWKTPE
jgi:hypothetical protein